MAHTPALCDLFSISRMTMGGAAHALSQWRQLIPTDCPLCSESAYGGNLCPVCVRLVTQAMHALAARCIRCCLVLPEGTDMAAAAECADCSSIKPAFQRVIAAFDYQEPGDLLIHRFKVQGRFVLAPVLAGLLADAVRRTQPGLHPQTVLVPVPASRDALLRRGFNPAAEVARPLGRLLQHRCRPDWLRRVHDGQKQATLDREQRMIATSRLYGVGADVRGAHIAIVDDVLTTGSTLHSIARLFRRAGAASVCGLVLARTPHGTHSLI